MSYHSYVIYAPESGDFFYGYFEDLEKVMELHNTGQIPPTRGKNPWVLLYSESFENRVRAIRQVSFYRSVKGQRFLRNVLNF